MTLIFNKAAILDVIHWFILAQRKIQTPTCTLRTQHGSLDLTSKYNVSYLKSHNMPLPFFGTFTIK